MGQDRVIAANSVQARVDIVKLQSQLLDSTMPNPVPIGRPFLADCVVNTDVNSPLLSGMGLRNAYWSTLSPGPQGFLAIASTMPL